MIITRAFAVGDEREETRAIVPPVGVRLWNRPPEPVRRRPALPVDRGGDG